MTQQPVHYGAPPPPPRKKSKALPIILGILGGIALLCVGGIVLAVALSGGDGGANGASASASATKTTAKIGQAARDGQFEFTVKKIQCGVAKIGGEFTEKKPQGQYCLITVTVKNIGKEARTLDDSNQKAYDAAGRQFSTDEAGLYVPNNDTMFINNINPGNSATGVIVFDIPADGKLTKIELHDSTFSGGIEVALA